MNKTQLIGRLTKNPELSYTAESGLAVTRFTLAVNRPHLDKSKPQEADFINCVCFGKRAEAIANYVCKGHMFSVAGRIQTKKYVNQEGQNRWSTNVVVEDFYFLQANSNTNQNPPAQSNNSTPDNNYDGILTPVDDGDIPF